MIKFNSKKFKSERKKAGFTQEAFAIQIRDKFPQFRKASKSLVSYWERGTTPHSNYLSAIAQILNREISFFLTEK